VTRAAEQARLHLDTTTAQRELAMRHELISHSTERLGDDAIDICD
jgi:hypothetical protein